MDLATIVGFVASFGIVAAGILLGGPMAMFVNGASIFIVIGGSLAVVLMRSSIGDFVGAISLAGQAFANKVDKPEDLIEKVVELATIARKDGMIALEGQEIANPFLSKAVSMLVDGTDATIIKSSLDRELASTKMRFFTATVAAVTAIAAYALPLKLNIVLAIVVAVMFSMSLERLQKPTGQST